MNDLKKYPISNPLLKWEYLYEGAYYLQNILTEDAWEIHENTVKFLSQLTGENDHYQIDPMLEPKEVDDILSHYKEMGWLDNDKKLVIDGLNFYYALSTPVFNKTHRLVAKYMKILLMITFFPVFIAGIVGMLDGYIYVDKKINIIWGFVISVILAVNLHEIAHGIAGVANRARVIQLGVRIKSFIPSVYVCLNTKNIKSNLKRFQIIAAGPIANLFLSGLYLCFLKLQMFDSGVLLVGGAINFLIALANSIPVIFDGEEMLSTLLEVPLLVEKAKYVVTNTVFRKELWSQGINGVTVIIFSYIVMGFQLIIPLYIIVMLCLTILL